MGSAVTMSCMPVLSRISSDVMLGWYCHLRNETLWLPFICGMTAKHKRLTVDKNLVNGCINVTKTRLFTGDTQVSSLQRFVQSEKDMSVGVVLCECLSACRSHSWLSLLFDQWMWRLEQVELTRDMKIIPSAKWWNRSAGIRPFKGPEKAKPH